MKIREKDGEFVIVDFNEFEAYKIACKLEKNLTRVGADREDGFEEDDLLNYMDYGVFRPYQDIKDLKRHIDSLPKALQPGVVIERKTIQFYQACQERSSSEQTKKELEHIITEEERHQQMFERALEDLNK